MNFGPLNRQGGERRLNVAVTRARELLMVFSTLRADQIDLSRTQARGVRDLKNFLDYAERGKQALTEAVTTEARADFDSPFEKEVARALEAAGWTIHSQIGVAGYRIDLGVVDPERPGAYLLGIECDGATYHSAKNARDRDRIRQGVLENLGWTIHRIWSTEWWHNRRREMQDLLEFLDELNDEPRSVTPKPAVATTEDEEDFVDEVPLPPKVDLAAESTDASMDWPENARPWRSVVVEAVDLESHRSFYAGAPSERTDIQQQITDVIETHGPLDVELVARPVAESWDKSRLTKKVRRRIRAIIEASPTLRLDDDEVWPVDVSSDLWDVFRYSDDESPSREVTDLVGAEVENAMLWTVERAIRVDDEAAMREVAGVFGFSRVGSRIRDHFEDIIAALLAREALIRSEGKLKISGR